MAKSRTIKDEDITPDYLVKPKTDFQKELESRINKGEELVSKQINSNVELANSKEEFSYWHDYNTELISRAFDRVKNKYYEDYTWTSSGGIVFGGKYDTPREPNLSEQIQLYREHIAKYLTRLKKIKEKIPLIDELPGLTPQILNEESNHAKALNKLQNIFLKFHKIAQSLRIRRSNRAPIIIQDEYDVQYLLHALLKLYFNSIKEEDYAPSQAGGNSRVDFVLKEEKIVIETKMTNERLSDKEIGNQLLIDIGRYKSHPDCELLVFFVYDKGDFVLNKPAMIKEIESMSSVDLRVKVFIEPNS